MAKNLQKFTSSYGQGCHIGYFGGKT